MRKLIAVKVNGYILECTMENGDVYHYDLSLIHKSSGPMVEPLKDQDFFSKVFIEMGYLSWPNGYEIHANTVAREGQLIEKAAS